MTHTRRRNEPRPFLSVLARCFCAVVHFNTRNKKTAPARFLAKNLAVSVFCCIFAAF